MGGSDAQKPLGVPEGTTLRLSKMEAATRQLEAAILALERSEWDIAITLAGAAEGMLESDKGLWRRLLDTQVAQALPTRRVVNALNREMYWLKHGGAETMTIKRRAAVRMVARALSKVGPRTSLIKAFAEWFDANKGAVR